MAIVPDHQKCRRVRDDGAVIEARRRQGVMAWLSAVMVRLAEQVACIERKMIYPRPKS